MNTGIYIRAIQKSIHGSPSECAKVAKSLGLSMVLFMTIWQEAKKTKIINSKTLFDYVKAMADVGIEPGIWGYPWVGKEREYVTFTQSKVEQLEGLLRWVVIDPELGYQFRKSSEERARSGAELLVTGLLDVVNESILFGTTSYGAAHVQKSFPWRDFVLGFGSPQFYKAARATIDLAVPAWRSKGFVELMPSLPLYGPNGGTKLASYADYVISRDPNAISGLLFWSWRQLDKAEKKAIKALSER